MDANLIQAILQGNVADYKPPELTLGKRIGRGLSDFAAGFADPTFAARRRMLEEQIAANLAGQVAGDRAAGERLASSQKFDAEQLDKRQAFDKSQAVIDRFRRDQEQQRRINADIMQTGAVVQGRKDVTDMRNQSAEEIRRLTEESRRAIEAARNEAAEPLRTANAELARQRTALLKADTDPVTEADVAVILSGIEDPGIKDATLQAYRAKLGTMTMGELKALTNMRRAATPAKAPMIGVPFTPTAGGPKVLGNIND